MADEPKPKENAKNGQTEAPSSAALSPAPTVVAGDSTKPAADPNSRIQAEPLSDGTVPTVLTPGQTHHSVAKSKASLTTIYRKADIMTTLLTFGGAVVAGAIIIGGYIYFTKSRAPTPTATPKVTNLSQSDLSKLQTFFQGNSAGSSAEVLTISSSSLFKNRVAVSSDLKVTGGVSVDGTTNLGDLNVDKTSTLGVVNTRGQLTVGGPLTVQSPALFNAGASYKGSISATGNGSFGGSLSAGSISVGTLSVTQLNINGHFSLGGQAPSASNGQIGVESNDSAGSVTGVTGSAPGDLVTITFHTAFPVVPTIIITPVGANSAKAMPYLTNLTASSFTIGAAGTATGPFSFNYWVIQ
ncbi:MAG TPA: hypothetical protein VGH44_02285 [Candidatus Saccharimonadia bacterium]|jgi:hypothetical protein